MTVIIPEARAVVSGAPATSMGRVPPLHLPPGPASCEHLLSRQHWLILPETSNLVDVLACGPVRTSERVRCGIHEIHGGIQEGWRVSWVRVPRQGSPGEVGWAEAGGSAGLWIGGRGGESRAKHGDRVGTGAGALSRVACGWSAGTGDAKPGEGAWNAGELIEDPERGVTLKVV